MPLRMHRLLTPDCCVPTHKGINATRGYRTALRPWSGQLLAQRNHRNSPSPNGRMPCLFGHGLDCGYLRSIQLPRSLSLTGRCPCRLSHLGDSAAMALRSLWMNSGSMWITGQGCG